MMLRAACGGLHLVEQRLQDNVLPGASYIQSAGHAGAVFFKNGLLVQRCALLMQPCSLTGSVVLMAIIVMQLLGFSTTATGIMVQFTTAGAAIGFLIGGACPMSRKLCSGACHPMISHPIS
jgi:hypothetical protein